MNPRADRCCKTGLWGSVATALCCLTPILVFLLSLVGLSFVTPYLDYLLVPLFAIFLLAAVYEWMWGGRIMSRRK
jgi:mercuric ion transport protein